MIELVYRNRANANTIVLRQDGELIDFTPVTRMVVMFNGSAAVVDSDSDSSLIDWSTGNGAIVFKLNTFDIIERIALAATLIAYDPLHAAGQVLVHAREKKLYFQFVD